jgi:hypothetical protein
MKRLLTALLFLLPMTARANWMLNPYTQRQDYYETALEPTISSSTVMNDYVGTSASFGSCVSGSSVTITIPVANARAEVNFSAGVGQTTQDMKFFGYMMDGTTADGGAPQTVLFSPATFAPVVFRVITPKLTAGAHGFCLTVATAGGSVFIYKSNPVKNIFWVKEIR